MTFPKTWKLIATEDDGASFRFRVRCGNARTQRLDGLAAMSPSLDTFRKSTHRFGTSRDSYHWAHGAWWCEFSRKNPAHTFPDEYALIYGLPDEATDSVVVRFPHGLTWQRELLPALHSVAMKHGGSLRQGGKRPRALLERVPEGTWNLKRMTLYAWADGRFEPFLRKTPPKGIRQPKTR